MKYKLAVSIGILVVLIIICGSYLYFHTSKQSRSVASPTLSETQAADLALRATISTKLTTLPLECLSAVTIATSTNVVIFDIDEVHGGTCGGDPMTTPRVTTVQVNVVTGKIIFEGMGT